MTLVKFHEFNYSAALRVHYIRSQWGADMFGAVRSVINTGGLHGLSPYESILATIEERSIINPNTTSPS